MTAAGWTQERFYAFDCETTGANPRTARIVTAALVMVGGGEPPAEVSWLIAPDVSIDSGAEQVHGVTNAHAHEHGMHPAEAIAEIAASLSRRPEGSPLVVYNARFDLTILRRECDRNRVERPPTESGVVDPLVIDKWLDKYRKGSRRLADVAAHYATPVLEDAHAAGADALTAARIAWRLGTSARAVRRRGLAQAEAEWEAARLDLGELHAAQVRWAHEQAEGLEAHFRKQAGREREIVERAWPVLLDDAERR